MTKISKVLYQVMRSEWQVAVRDRHELANPLLFFVVVISLFPLAISPDPQLLQTLGAGAIWVACLLAILLGLERLFRSDYEQGVLEQWCVAPYPLSLMVLMKVLMHWLLAGLPLIIVTPLLAIMLHLNSHEMWVLVGSLLLGTPILCLLGAIGVALTIGLQGNGMLLSLLVLPLTMPVLIFGAGSAMNAAAGVPVAGQFALLGALLITAIALAPIAISAAIRIGI